MKHLDEIIAGVFILFVFLFLFFAKPIEASGEAEIEQTISQKMAETAADALKDVPDVKESEIEEVSFIEYPFVDDTNTNITEDDIELLARLITAECGYPSAYREVSDYEEACYLTGAVVLNRIASPDFPNNLYDVIHQKGQYSCTWDGNIWRDYDDIAWEIAEQLLTYGVEDAPTDLIWQAGFPQGKTYKIIRGIYFGEKK